MLNLRKRTRSDDDEDSALLSACHHDLEKVSENLTDGNGVLSGTGMPDMSDSAWLAIKTKTETQKNEQTTDAKSVEPLPKNVDNLLVTVSSSLDKKQNKKLQQSQSEGSLRCDSQAATRRSESVDVVS